MRTPQIGLDLIRKLVDTAVEHHADGKKAETNGFTIVIDGKPRFFPWVQTYFWSRSMQAQEYSAASGLMALEAWSQERLDKGEDVDAVLRDILGPEGSCAAYLLIALDVLLSHWPTTRDALVPFVANPDLLANDRTRSTFETLGRHDDAAEGAERPRHACRSREAPIALHHARAANPLLYRRG